MHPLVVVDTTFFCEILKMDIKMAMTMSKSSNYGVCRLKMLRGCLMQCLVVLGIIVDESIRVNIPI